MKPSRDMDIYRTILLIMVLRSGMRRRDVAATTFPVATAAAREAA